MSKITHTNKFSSEQVEYLRSNPHVSSVTATTVRFTRQFQLKFLLERQAGKMPSRIFEEAGIDPAVLGLSRIKSTSYVIQRKWRSISDDQLDARLQQLEQEIECAREEMEIIKRMQRERMARSGEARQKS